MSDFDVDIEEIKKLVELADKHNLEELKVEESDFTVTLKRGTKSAEVFQTPVNIAHPAVNMEIEQEIEDENVDEEEIDESNLYLVTAPLVGVFYRSSSPDTPPFVEVGETIEVGTELGLIEAMKVFSPIPSEVAGEVVEICIENGKLVSAGDIIMKIRVEK